MERKQHGNHYSSTLGKLDPISELICELRVVDSQFAVLISYLIKWHVAPGVQNVFLRFGSMVPCICRCSNKLDKGCHGDSLCLLHWFVPWEHPVLSSADPWKENERQSLGGGWLLGGG